MARDAARWTQLMNLRIDAVHLKRPHAALVSRAIASVGELREVLTTSLAIVLGMPQDIWSQFTRRPLPLLGAPQYIVTGSLIGFSTTDLEHCKVLPSVHLYGIETLYSSSAGDPPPAMGDVSIMKVLLEIRDYPGTEWIVDREVVAIIPRDPEDERAGPQIWAEECRSGGWSEPSCREVSED
jgi:hypothetical protein